MNIFIFRLWWQPYCSAICLAYRKLLLHNDVVSGKGANRSNVNSCAEPGTNINLQNVTDFLIFRSIHTCLKSFINMIHLEFANWHWKWWTGRNLNGNRVGYCFCSPISVSVWISQIKDIITTFRARANRMKHWKISYIMCFDRCRINITFIFIGTTFCGRQIVPAIPSVIVILIISSPSSLHFLSKHFEPRWSAYFQDKLRKNSFSTLFCTILMWKVVAQNHWIGIRNSVKWNVFLEVFERQFHIISALSVMLSNLHYCSVANMKRHRLCWIYTDLLSKLITHHRLHIKIALSNWFESFPQWRNFEMLLD